MGKTAWGYSNYYNPDRWEGMHTTREEALRYAQADYPGCVVYLSKGRVPEPDEFIPDVDYLMEQMSERAQDEAGEAAEEFPGVTNEAKTELEGLLRAWCRKHVKVNFWVSDGEPERVEPSDV